MFVCGGWGGGVICLSRVCGTLPGGVVGYCVGRLFGVPLCPLYFVGSGCIGVWFDVWRVVWEGLASSALAVMSWAMSTVYSVTCWPVSLFLSLLFLRVLRFAFVLCLRGTSGCFGLKYVGAWGW